MSFRFWLLAFGLVLINCQLSLVTAFGRGPGCTFELVNRNGHAGWTQDLGSRIQDSGNPKPRTTNSQSLTSRDPVGTRPDPGEGRAAGATIEVDEALTTDYDRDNVQYFHGKLPEVIVGWADLPDALGVTYWQHGRPVAIAIDQPLRDYSSTVAGCVLVHEEAHIASGKGHGHDKRFRKLMLRLIKDGGCRGLIGE